MEQEKQENKKLSMKVWAVIYFVTGYFMCLVAYALITFKLQGDYNDVYKVEGTRGDVDCESAYESVSESVSRKLKLNCIKAKENLEKNSKLPEYQRFMTLKDNKPFFLFMTKDASLEYSDAYFDLFEVSVFRQINEKKGDQSKHKRTKEQLGKLIDLMRSEHRDIINYQWSVLNGYFLSPALPLLAAAMMVLLEILASAAASRWHKRKAAKDDLV